MLSMKTLRVAVAVVGSALLLLGSGFAAATVQHLDGTPAPGTPPPAAPAEYVYELLTEGTGQALTAPTGILSPRPHTTQRLVVGIGRLIESTDSTYVRLALGGGMVFDGSAIDLKWMVGSSPEGRSCTYDDDTRDETPGAQSASYPTAHTIGLGVSVVHSSGGRKGDNYVVFRLAPDAADYDGDSTTEDSSNIPSTVRAFDADATETDDHNNSETCDLVAMQNRLWVDVFDLLAIPADTGSYTASISLHSDPDDAQAGSNPSPAVSGTATIVKSVAGRDVEVKASLTPAVAHVGTAPEPFLWFRDRSTATGLSSMAILGSAKATLAARSPGQMPLLNPGTGLRATPDQIIKPESLTITVEGDLSIGAFNLGTNTATDPACVGPGSPARSSMGNLDKADSNKNTDSMASLGSLSAGTYHLCVQVDTAGPGSNTTPIPAGRYHGAITEGTGTLAREIASGVIGQIRRNGTTVKLTYLTVSTKYNQRLVIVNDGGNDARYEIGPFVTEDGTTATAKAAASGTVSAGSKVVLRVADLVEFDGPQKRASATLSMNADVDDVQVATTQVTLDDGSTDTVIYAVVDGAVVQ